MKHQVTITSNGAGHGSIHVDGQDMSRAVRGLEFRSDVGDADQLKLDLVVFEGSQVDSDEAEVIIPDETRKALEALGWTPPEEG